MDWPEFVVFVADAGVVELPPFFAFAVDVVCAPAIDPAIRNALIQKLAANFKYLFIGILFPKQVSTSITPSVHPPLCAASIQLPQHRTLQLRPSACCDTNDIFQSASADLNFMQSG